MSLTFESLPDTVKAVFTSAALQRFDSLDSDARSLLLDAADKGVRLEVVDGDSNSLGWRIATWAGASAVAADVYLMKRGEVDGFVGTNEPRIACVRQGIHIARMLLLVDKVDKDNSKGP